MGTIPVPDDPPGAQGGVIFGKCSKISKIPIFQLNVPRPQIHQYERTIWRSKALPGRFRAHTPPTPLTTPGEGGATEK